jgi:hypothetical protein
MPCCSPLKQETAVGLSDIAAGLLHIGSSEQAFLAEHYLGCVTWKIRARPPICESISMSSPILPRRRIQHGCGQSPKTGCIARIRNRQAWELWKASSGFCAAEESDEALFTAVRGASRASKDTGESKFGAFVGPLEEFLSMPR